MDTVGSFFQNQNTLFDFQKKTGEPFFHGSATSQLVNMTLSSIFFLTLLCLSCEVQLLVQISCQYHYWFQSYDNFPLKGIEQKYGNRKYLRLSFAQYSIWRLGRVRDIKFGMIVSNKMLLNTTKCQGYSLLLSYNLQIQKEDLYADSIFATAQKQLPEVFYK